MHSQFAHATRTIALATVVVAASSGGAHAALVCSGVNTVGPGTCTETIQITANNVDLTAAILTIDQLPSFASAGFTQTLTGVNWTVSAQVQSFAQFSNPTAAFISFTVANNISVAFIGGAGAPASFIPGGLLSTRSFTSPPFGLNPGGALNLNLLPASTTPESDSATSLAGYGGNGTFQALVYTQTVEVASDIGISMSGRTFSTTPQITLTYNFQTTAVPEAPSVVLMGLGLAGLALVSRRRRHG